MKNFLTKFRLSNSLDNESGGAIPEALRQKIGTNPELRDFARRTAELDLALRRPPDVPAAESALHPAIMRAVRASAPESAQPRVPLRLGLAATFGALAAVFVLFAIHSTTPDAPPMPSEAQKKAVQQIVMNIGEISRAAPVDVVAPLSNEWASVDHDIRNTTRFILASLP